MKTNNRNATGRWAMMCMLLITFLYPMIFSYDWSKMHYISAIAFDFFLVYVITLLISLISKGKVRKAVFRTVLTLTTILAFLKVICQICVHGPVGSSVLAAVLATNAEEAGEMASTFLTAKMICALAGLPVAMIVCHLAGRKLKDVKMNKLATRCCLAGAIACGCVSAASLVLNKQVVYDEVALTLITEFSKARQASAYHIQLTHPKVTVDKEKQPAVVVWIVGESTTRRHCSLYGYDKITNPLLQKKVDDGEAYAFNNINSADTHTQECFQQMMTTYSKSAPETTEWYKCTTLPEVAHLAGYHTSWISNQHKVGIFENYVGQLSEFCDTSAFVNKYAEHTNLDGELLPITKKMMKHGTGKDFYVINLMGCHKKYEKRYPTSFARFSASEYGNKPGNQRCSLAAYDNAVLYNDFIVNSIFDLFSQSDAIVVYAPDHGLDLFESTPDYDGHAIQGNAKSEKLSREIPLVIYMSPLYRKNHPDMAARVAKSVNRKYDMEDAIYLMMDLMKCDFANPTVAKKTLLLPLK